MERRLSEMANSTLSERCKFLVATLLVPEAPLASIFDDANVDTNATALEIRNVDEIIEEMESSVPIEIIRLQIFRHHHHNIYPTKRSLADNVYDLNGSGKRAKVVFSASFTY